MEFKHIGTDAPKGEIEMVINPNPEERSLRSLTTHARISSY